MTEVPVLDILLLGAGWTGTFLIPLLKQLNIPFAATTSDGRAVSDTPTIKFRFDAADTSPEAARAFAALPHARLVLIVFPLEGAGTSRALVTRYCAAHGGAGAVRFVQLGSTGIWTAADAAQAPWLSRASPYDAGGARAVAEDELRGLGGCVLALAGLWGGARAPRHWVGRVAATKAAVRAKTSLHMVHGVDVARVIVALVDKARTEWAAVGQGQRWMVTDGFVYDWWSLFAAWADTAEGKDNDDGGVGEEPSKQARWVHELMQEEGIRALPRPMEVLGRCYDSRELWSTLGITPLKAGLGLR